MTDYYFMIATRIVSIPFALFALSAIMMMVLDDPHHKFWSKLFVYSLATVFMTALVLALLLVWT